MAFENGLKVEHSESCWTAFRKDKKNINNVNDNINDAEEKIKENDNINNDEDKRQLSGQETAPTTTIKTLTFETPNIDNLLKCVSRVCVRACLQVQAKVVGNGKKQFPQNKATCGNVCWLSEEQIKKINEEQDFQLFLDDQKENVKEDANFAANLVKEDGSFSDIITNDKAFNVDKYDTKGVTALGWTNKFYKDEIEADCCTEE